MSNELEFEGQSALVIEDELFMRNLIIRLLQELGFETSTPAEDGAAAMQILESTGAYFDVIILDLDMPLIDGFDFIRMLRGSNQVSDNDIPVVVVTGNSEGRNLTKAVELGIHGFLVKPVSKKTLSARLTRALRRERLSFNEKKTPKRPQV